MTPAKWFLLTIGGAAFIGYAAWWYRTREEPVTGRGWAAALRAATLLVAWLILLNPSWPAAFERARGREVALLDASYSMSRSSAEGAEPSLWQLAGDSVARFGGAWLFGGAVPRFVSSDSIPEAPSYSESRLAPALRAAARSGTRRVTVFTDGEIRDISEAVEEARRLGLAVSVHQMGTGTPRVGIAELSASDWVEVGDTAVVRVEIVAAASGIDSVDVQVVDDAGVVRAIARAPLPTVGRFSAVRLAFSVSGRAGRHRYVARLSASLGDTESRDDERVFYVRTMERPAGPVLISLRPDWEPSFLLPNLNRVTEVPGSTYLWLANGPVGVGGNYGPVQVSTVLRRARSAPMLVLHGYAANAPQWARELVRTANRLLVFPAGERAFELPGWGITVGAPAGAEWYASSDIPQSPLVLELGDLPAQQLPPLLRVRTVRADRTWTPLTVRRLRRGEAVPAIVAGSVEGRRFVVATAEGYWRWAFRQGAGRQLYRTLWTGLAGWLMEGRREGGLGLDPQRFVVTRDQPLQWTTPGGVDSMSLQLVNADGEGMWSGSAGAGDSIDVILAPGQYSYIARAYRDELVVASASGPAEVERFAPELLPASASNLSELFTALSVAAESEVGRDGRQLATLGWPYLLLIALFCTEWAVRRLIGLR